MSAKVIVIIINWKKEKITKNCLLSLKNGNYKNFQVILIENRNYKSWNRFFKSVNIKGKTIYNNGNKGVAESRNIGIKRALNIKAKYIWFLDNDTLVDDRAITKMVRIMEKEKGVDILTSIITFSNKNIIWFAGGGFKYFFKYFLIFKNYYRKNLFNIYPNKGKLKKVDYLVGCSIFTRANVFKKIGFFDPDYSLYNLEDLDFCFRAKKRNLGIYIWGERLVRHLKISRKSNLFQDKISENFAFFMGRNQFIFANKNLKGLTKFFYTLSLYNIRLFWYLYLCDSWQAKLEYLKGLYQGTLWLFQKKSQT